MYDFGLLGKQPHRTAFGESGPNLTAPLYI